MQYSGNGTVDRSRKGNCYSEEFVLFALVLLHHLQILFVLDLLWDDVMEKLHALLPLDDVGQVLVRHLE